MASIISRPNFQKKVFTITGTAPLVIRRFSTKVKAGLRATAEAGQAARNKKVREPWDAEATYNEARYVSKEGWDGLNASAFRLAIISACRLVGFKMTIAKLSVFIEADGWDAKEPQIPLVRIYGEPRPQEDVARVQTGQPYITIRPVYNPWSAKVTVRWDGDQFTEDDVRHLLMRVGQQVGLGEGRPDSKSSAGMGWGLFEVEES